MTTEQRIFTILLLILALFMTVTSFRYSPGARTLPFLSGIFTVVMLTALVSMTFSSKIRAWYQKIEKQPELSAEVMKKEEKRREFSVAGWFLGCVVVIYSLGFQIGTSLFLFMILKIRERESWLLSLVLAAVTSGVIYFVFGYLLRVPLHKGILFE